VVGIVIIVFFVSFLVVGFVSIKVVGIFVVMFGGGVGDGIVVNVDDS